MRIGVWSSAVCSSDRWRHIEPRLGPAVEPFPAGQDGGTPDIMLLQIDELVIVDNLAGRTYLVVYADPSQAEAFALARRRLKELREKLRTPVEIGRASCRERVCQ